MDYAEVYMIEEPDAAMARKALLDARARNEGLLMTLRDLIEAGDDLVSAAMISEPRRRWAALRLMAKNRYPELQI